MLGSATDPRQEREVDGGPAAQDWSGDMVLFEYSRAADPVSAGHTPKIPMRQFAAALHDPSTPTGIVPLDLSEELGIIDGPATSPGLCAYFVHLRAGEAVETRPRATSELYFVLSGGGHSVVDGSTINWGAGDFLTLPAEADSVHHGHEDTVLYWVTDEPLLRYLGVTPTERRFRATHYPAAVVGKELADIAAAPHALERNRLSVLLSNSANPETRTITHTLWAMFGLLPKGELQPPHRHQSVALDLIVECEPGCYTILGRDIDADGNIVKPTRIDWEPGGAFVTPPGMWHAHVNESGADAYLVPIQDAGLQTFLRSLDIRFAKR